MTTCGAVLCLALLAGQASAPNVGEPALTAKSAILMEASTGQILYEREAQARRFPASLTKIVTAAVVLEQADLADEVVVSERAVTAGEASLGLTAGERVSMQSLLAGILVKSANDACVAAAEHVAGSVEQFATLMNQKAREWGARRSHFTNPHGLDEPAHYSTAYDLTQLARHALKNPTFSALVATHQMLISTAKTPEGLLVENRNKLLSLYPGCDGVKTGYTLKAGRCLIASATRGDRQLIATVLASKDPLADCTAMLDYGFTAFSLRRLVDAEGSPLRLPVIGGTAPYVLARPARTVCRAVTKTEKVSQQVRLSRNPLIGPVAAGEQLGTAEVSLRGRPYASVPLVAVGSVGVDAWWAFRDRYGVPLLVALIVVSALALWLSGRGGRKGR